MKRILCVLSVVSATLLSLQAAEPRKELITVPDGAGEITVKGTIKGHDVLDYQLDAKAGQELTISLTSNRGTEYFNLLPPDEGEALFVGSMSADDKKTTTQKLPSNGRYTIRLYLMGNAKDEGLTAEHNLVVKLSAAENKLPEKLSLQGIDFGISAKPTEDGHNILTITPSGLEKDNTPVMTKVSGKVIGADIADLNADGSPEIYLFSVSGDNHVIHLTAYAANNKKSLSQIYLPPLADDEKNAKGYIGYDEFAVVENVLARRFKLFEDGKYTGKTRQLQYKLHAGEAGWVLKLDKVTEY